MHKSAKIIDSIGGVFPQCLCLPNRVLRLDDLVEIVIPSGNFVMLLSKNPGRDHRDNDTSSH
jgi:hypothetical protein